MSRPDVSAVRCVRDGSTLTITIANGERNLLDPEVMGAFSDALRSADADPDVLAVVITGSGDVFCGGLDIQALRSSGDPADFATTLVELLRLLPDMGIAVIGAVNGDALAAGFSIACACDLVVAVPEA